MSELDEIELLGSLLYVVEHLAKYPSKSIQEWHDTLVKMRPAPDVRQSVHFVQPCIEEFLQKLAEKKRLME